MKPKKQYVLMAVCAAALAWGRAAGGEEGRRMSVQVRVTQVRAAPSFLAAVLAEAKYGDRLKVETEQGAWTRVATADGGTAGWVHSSALTRKRIVLAASEKDPELAASSGELALAGKGFNKDVEAEFKRSHKDADFTWVDTMEQWKATAAEMLRFLKTGGLKW